MEVAQFPPVDMISNLPDDLLDNILLRLTTRDTAKTSVLSKRWRYKWVKLPQLIFHERLEYGGAQMTELDRMKFLLILYRVLLHHQAPITKFSLYFQELHGCPEIDDLIRYLSKNGVEEFTFEIDQGCKIPPSLFMCSQLKYLNLCTCEINPPPTFKGFNGLTRLELQYVDIEGEELERLISSCPLLEELVLTIEFIDSLNIDAPTLKLLDLTTCATVSFKNCPLLAIVSLSFESKHEHVGFDVTDSDDDDREDGDGASLQFFESLPALEKLCIDVYHVKKLIAGLVQTTPPANLAHLKILKLSELCLDSLDDLSFVLWLIRSSPNLEKIEIRVDPVYDEIAVASPVLDFLEVQDYSDIYLNQLREVEVRFIFATVAEMTIIKLLLTKSPQIKRVVVWMHTRNVADNELAISEELKTYAPNAKIDFEIL